MASPIFPLLQKFAQDEWVKLDTKQITPWAFFHGDHGIRISRFGENPITVGGGIEFSGSAEDLFWHRYIEPFLEDATLRALAQARSIAIDRNQPLEDPLKEAAGQMVALSRKAFRRMAEIDRRLRGKGHPESVPLRDTGQEIASVEAFISRHLAAELAMLKRTRWQIIEEHYKRYPAGYWIAGTLLASGLTILGFFLQS